MKIALYKDLSDSFKLIDVEPGKTIKEALPEVNFNSKIILVNGLKAESDHIITTSDIIAIRSIPMGISTTGMAVITGLLSAASIIYSIYQGVKVQKMQQELAYKEKYLFSVDESVVNVPTLPGASNSIATGKTQPYVIGRHLLTPYVMNKGNGSATTFKGYHSISGEKGRTQFFNTVLECGFNKQYIEQLCADDIVIRQFTNEENQEGTYPIVGNSIFATDNSFCEIAQDGNNFDNAIFQNKIIEETAGETLNKCYDDNYESLFYTLPKYARSADICIKLPEGLCAFTAAGSKVGRAVKVIPSYSLDYLELVASGNSNPEANATWVDFPFNVVTNTTTKTETTAEYRLIKTYGSNPDKVPSSDSLKRKFLNANKDLWQLIKGPDLRNADYQIKSYVYQGNSTWKIIVKNVVVTTSQTTTDTYDIVDNELKESYFNAHVDFNYADVKNITQPVTIRLKDESVDAETLYNYSSVYDTVNVAWIQSTIYDADKSAEENKFVNEAICDDKERALSVLLGVHLEATTANESKLNKLNVITNGVARTWDGEEWSETKTPTSNLASWLLEVLTSETHKPSQIDFEEEIDSATFGALYEYCEENEINVNMVLTEGVTKESIITDLCKIGNCVLYNNIYGKIAVAIDKAKDSSIALLNSQDLISFGFKRSAKRRVDGIRITYNESAENYEEQTYLVMYNGRTYNSESVITAQNLKGITENAQIVKYARREMAVEELRPDEVTAEIGMEGIFYTPLSKVLVQHASMKKGLGHAEIKRVITSGNYITGLEFYEPVEYDSSESFGLICQCVSSSYCTTKEMSYTASTNDRVYEVVLDEPIRTDASVIPHAHDIVSYGYTNNGAFDYVYTPYIITDISKNESSITLSLVEYNEEIYNSGTIPEYTPRLTERKTPLNTEPENLNEIRTEIQTAKADAIEYSKPSRIVQYWAAASSNTVAPSVFSTDPTSEIATMTSTLRYLWNYTEYQYSDGTKKQSGSPAVIGVYGEKGEAGSGYNLDISPEQQSLLSTFIADNSNSFQLKVSFFNDAEDLHTAATFKATINGVTVGTWENTIDGKIVTIPTSSLNTNSDLTSIIITVTYGEITRGALATVTKIYSGQDAVIYKMLFSATNIKMNASGEKSPENITVTKRKVNAAGESETQKGYITVSVDGGEPQKTNTMINQADSDYNSSETYYNAVLPFLLYTDETKQHVIGNGINDSTCATVGAVFYK